MLSYMLPVEDKTSTQSSDKGRLQLELSDGAARPPPAPLKSSIISKESSVSSFAGSDITSSSITPTDRQDKPKLKLLTNGTKHTSLKRVSFGSSKGSMVETLIYESPLQEEPELSPPAPPPTAIPPLINLTDSISYPFPADILSEQEESERSKVRVSFFQGARAQSVSEQSQLLDLIEADQQTALAAAQFQAAMAAASPDHAAAYNRQASTESGWDNPFRPDGDLSREAEEIVSLFRGGKPITPTPNSATTPLLPAGDEVDCQEVMNKMATSPITQSPQKQTVGSPLGNAAVKNGGASNGTDTNHTPASGTVDTVQRSGPQEPMQPEHVTIKKKPKCKCCVIQ